MSWILGAALLLASPPAPRYYTYVGTVRSDSVLLAWGTASGPGNTIGRQSVSHGRARVRLGDQVRETDRNWIEWDGLDPDCEYSYQVNVNGTVIGRGRVRTHPARAERLAFFVIGDYGTGSRAQYRIAEAMWREFEKRAGTANPVRFVLTAGDNIYASSLFGVLLSDSGDEDRDWEKKFFIPNERLLARIPFYPAVGNHDGNHSESRGDLAVYLDNFFFPNARPELYYTFSFGGLADFFALDTTENTDENKPAPTFGAGGEQYDWLNRVLAESQAPWKLAYFHHAPFTAGPRHEPALGVLRHIVDLLGRHGVDVVFNGHEHNFQFSRRNEATGGALYIVSGAGGQVRRGDVRRGMEDAHIAGWSPQRHFLLVEIDRAALRITPLGDEPIVVRDGAGRRVEMPLVLPRRNR